MKFKIKSLLLVSLSISMLLLSGCGNDTSNNVSDNSNNTNTTDNSAAENSTNNNSNNTAVLLMKNTIHIWQIDIIIILIIMP